MGFQRVFSIEKDEKWGVIFSRFLEVFSCRMNNSYVVSYCLMLFYLVWEVVPATSIHVSCFTWFCTFVRHIFCMLHYDNTPCFEKHAKHTLWCPYFPLFCFIFGGQRIRNRQWRLRLQMVMAQTSQAVMIPKVPATRIHPEDIC